MSKRLSNFRMAWYPKLQKSFSLPKNMRRKKHLLVQRRDERAIQVCNHSKTSTDLGNDDVTSDVEWTDFLDDFEDLSTNEESSSREVALSTDFEDLSTYEESSIDVARSTVNSNFDGFIPVASSTPKSNRRTNVMNHDGIKEFEIFSEQERIVREPMILYLSPEMEVQDVFSADSNFDENSPVMCSTPKLNRRAKVMNRDGINKFKIFTDFSEQESTIKEGPLYSYLMSPERKSREVVSENPMFSYPMSPERKSREVVSVYSNFDENSLVMCSTPKLNGRDIEDCLQETFVSSILIPDISVILKGKDVTKLPNENRLPTAEEIVLEATDKRHSFLETKASNVLEKEPIYKCSSDSEIENLKPSRRDKERLKNISVCCLNIPHSSKELKKSKPIVKTSKIGAEGCLPVMTSTILENRCHEVSKFGLIAFRTRLSIKDRLKKKRTDVSICCLGTLECVLPPLNMAVPSISVKNALKAMNKKTTAPV